MGCKRRRHGRTLEDGFGLGLGLLGRHLIHKRKRRNEDEGYATGHKRARMVMMNQRPLLPRDVPNPELQGATSTAGPTRTGPPDSTSAGISDGSSHSLGCLPDTKSLRLESSTFSHAAWEQIREMDVEPIPLVANIVTLNDNFAHGVPPSHNFSPPTTPEHISSQARDHYSDQMFRNFNDLGNQFCSNLSPSLQEPSMNTLLVEQIIAPRKLVIAAFEDTDKVSRDFTVLFDPLSEVSFATRRMIQQLGKRIFPWKPVPFRGYHTLAGVFGPEEFAILRTTAPAHGIDTFFPLKVAVLDTSFDFADFCFGRPAIEQMALQFKDFKKALQGLCGYLGDDIDKEPDEDQGEEVSAVCSDLPNSGAEAHPRKRPRTRSERHLGHMLEILPEHGALPSTPPLSQCTTSESKLASQPPPTPFMQFPPVSLAGDPFASFWATDCQATTKSGPVNSEVQCQYHTSPMFTQAGANSISLPVCVSVSQPLSSVGLTPIPAFSLPEPFSGRPHGTPNDDGLN